LLLLVKLEKRSTTVADKLIKLRKGNFFKRGVRMKLRGKKTHLVNAECRKKSLFFSKNTGLGAASRGKEEGAIGRRELRQFTLG